MRIWVVDNGSQWTHREWRVLRYLGQDTRIVRNDAPVADLKAAGLDGVVLSGGAAEPAKDGRLGSVSDYLDGLDVPILGICAGHQYMAHHFGGRLVPGHSPEFGRTEVTITDPDDLLKGIPSPTVVWANHNDEVERLPARFKVLASSPGCPVQVMRHETRPLFGTQFHPEVEHTVDGVAIFRNFVRICETHKAGRSEAAPARKS
jgi:GMP synthase (glutamine-hydrolysing)